MPEPTTRPDVSADLDALSAVDADLSGVESTLRRLDDGSYGTCGGCGVELAEEDLPGALCSGCAAMK